METVTNFFIAPPQPLRDWLMPETEFRSTAVADVDYRVLLKIRSCVFTERLRFKQELEKILAARCSVEGACFQDLWLIYYQPGDYAEAARFLWERKEADHAD